MMAQRYVPVWGFKMYPPENRELTKFNRQLRNWLAVNIGCGTWETEMKGDGRWGDAYILVTIDKDAEEDAMAFKLRWL